MWLWYKQTIHKENCQKIVNNIVGKGNDEWMIDDYQYQYKK